MDDQEAAAESVAEADKMIAKTSGNAYDRNTEMMHPFHFALVIGFC